MYTTYTGTNVYAYTYMFTGADAYVTGQYMFYVTSNAYSRSFPVWQSGTYYQNGGYSLSSPLLVASYIPPSLSAPAYNIYYTTPKLNVDIQNFDLTSTQLTMTVHVRPTSNIVA